MDNTPLRILEVITPSRYSGAERALSAMAGELVRQGHEVLVASKPLPLFREELDKRRVPCCELPLTGKWNLRVGARLGALIRDFRPHLVHTHLSTASWWGALAAHRAGLPCVAHYHGLSHPYWYHLADHLVVPSAGSRDALLQRGWSPSRVHHLYYGLESDGFRHLPDRAAVRYTLGIPPDAPLLGVVAHLTPRKGHHVFLEALRLLSDRHPTLHALLIGEGPLREPLDRWCARHGLAERVTFLGYRRDALALIKALDVAVLPSLRGEGLGIFLLEAARLGVPAVASGISGLSEAIQDGVTGLLVPPGDPVALAETLDRLLSAADLRRSLATAAQTRMADSFNLEAQTAALVDLFRRVLP